MSKLVITLEKFDAFPGVYFATHVEDARLETMIMNSDPVVIEDHVEAVVKDWVTRTEHPTRETRGPVEL